jgi:polyisoprenoid-binding protein YceI
MKKYFVMLAALALVSCKSSSPVAKIDSDTLVLDKVHSKLSAIAMKNEIKEVEVRFPNLDGTLQLSPFKGIVNVGIDTLDTGDKTRDANIETLFFEVAMAAMNKSASFELDSLQGDLSTLQDGQSFPMTGKGTLSIHGAKVDLSGPLNITKLAGGGYSASFSDLWTVNIKDAGMLDQLANLNKNCPQPHRVGLNVKMKGELVYIKQ